jgi:hypothetical protein
MWFVCARVTTFAGVNNYNKHLLHEIQGTYHIHS